MTATVAFIGLGVMGFPMAGHLANAGYTTRVYNRTRSRAREWTERYNGVSCATIADTVRDADFVMTCVGADPDLTGIFKGPDGIIANAKAGALVIDHTTASATIAEQLARDCEEHGIGFMDAPVSGGQAGAENGQLTIMCGGHRGHFEQVAPILECYSRACKLMGTAGAGQKTKMVNQIAIAGLLQGLSEALNFAEHANLNIEKVVEVISKGAAQSWQMENRSGTMASGEFEHGFAVDWMRKDLAICLNEARKNGASLPVTAVVDQFYADVQAMGGSRWDTSSLIQRLRDKK